MKKYFLYFVLAAMTLGMKAQTTQPSGTSTTENWYGLIPIIDGFTDELIVPIS